MSRLNVIRTHGLCVSAAVFYQLSYEDPYIGKNWPALNVRVFKVQLVEHCSAIAEPSVRIPLKSRNFFRVNLHLLKLQLPLRRPHLPLKFVFSHFTSSSFKDIYLFLLLISVPLPCTPEKEAQCCAFALLQGTPQCVRALSKTEH